MHEVNVAFERLKATIPHHRLKQIDEKKDTKITTLRCAITYINSLRYTHSLKSQLKGGKSHSCNRTKQRFDFDDFFMKRTRKIDIV